MLSLSNWNTVFIILFPSLLLSPVKAFLTRVAHTTAGARELVAQNSLLYLSECKFIDMRPDHHSNSNLIGGPFGAASVKAGFIPSISDRYRQIFLPFLRFVLALLTCPGPQQSEACAQVTTLIGAHSEVFAAVLKDHHSVSMASLQELVLVTGIIGHSKVGKELHGLITCSTIGTCT